MELAVHLPLMQFGEDRLSMRRLEATVDTARECGFAAVAANDHLVFQTPWLVRRPREHCAELLTRYGEAGCERVYLWPLGDETHQLELVAETVAPELHIAEHLL